MFYPPLVLLFHRLHVQRSNINPPSTKPSMINQQLQPLICPTRSTHHPAYYSERTSARAALLRRVVRSPLASCSIQPLLIYHYRLQAIVLPEICSIHQPLFTMVHDSSPILIHTDHLQTVQLLYWLHVITSINLPSDKPSHRLMFIDDPFSH